MKIGIITFHDASNYGACLQAQATIAAFNIYVKDVEIINYTNKYRKGIYDPKQKIISSLRAFKLKDIILYTFGYYGIVSRNQNFRYYREKHLRISKNIIRNSKELNSFAINYTTIVAGSDQIWNLKNNGADLNYLLKFSSNKHKTISLSSSMTSTSIPSNISKEFFALLKRIKHLSVRESETKFLIEEKLKIKVEETLDPVLLFDRDYWDQFISKKIKIKNYDLVYVNNTRFFPKSRKQIISIGSFHFKHIFSPSVRILNNHGPSEFIYLIKNANFVHTSSFHGVIMCLIYNKPFNVYLSGDKGRDSRIKNLLDKFDLLNTAIWPNQKNVTGKNIDFSIFNSKIITLRNKTFNFIKNSIED